ncbi:hypothetical protein [Streptomyces violaceusniger]|uniref:hypothetical protein n=1 Tax=Streptomyces violaceusniger TaxID=68280 RepID=UPI00123790C6|nr:hypothetical protein [Streptomyces violaceusniger]
MTQIIVRVLGSKTIDQKSFQFTMTWPANSPLPGLGEDISFTTEDIRGFGFTITRIDNQFLVDETESKKIFLTERRYSMLFDKDIHACLERHPLVTEFHLGDDWWI